MELKINDWINFVKEAWHRLIWDYRRFGEQTGYGHTREEDIRCFLFCKIMDLLHHHKMFLINLHADIPLLDEKRADLVLGVKEDAWELGIEVKRTGELRSVEGDLEKLQDFMRNKKIEVGIFLTIAPHAYNLREMLELRNVSAEFKLEQKDNGNNNFTEWHRIKIDEYNKDWDTLFLVLRSI